MRILNTYIIKQIIVGFLLISFSLLSMLWLTQSLHFVEMVTRQGLPVYLFAEMTSLLMPRIFNVLSPVALFVAVLFVYNRMISDRELAAMQSAGISPWHIGKAAFAVGFLLVIVNVFVMNFGIPAAEDKFRDLEWRVKNNLTQMIFREGEFTSIRDGITVFIDKHENDGTVSGIFISDETKPGLKVTLTAEKGRLIQSDKGPRILFINGVRQEINKETFKFNSLSFSRYSAEFDFGHKSKRNSTVREKNIRELLSSGSNPDLTAQEQRKNIVEGNRRIISPFYNLVYALLACSGLLVCSFNRRGQTKVILIEVLLMIAVSSGDLMFANLSGRSLYFIPFMYLNCILPLLGCMYILLFYNPFSFNYRKRQGEWAHV